jgi:hypothetical protein
LTYEINRQREDLAVCDEIIIGKEAVRETSDYRANFFAYIALVDIEATFSVRIVAKIESIELRPFKCNKSDNDWVFP